MVDIVGVGALNWDLLLKVGRLAGSGEEIVVKNVEEEAGGSAANTIAGLGRLGVSCGFIGRVGSDEAGQKIIDAFKADSVDTSMVIRSVGRSGTVYSFVDDSGERTMYVDPGVNDAFQIEDLDPAYLSSARMVHVSSFAGASAFSAVKRIPEFLGDSALSFSPGFLSARGIDSLRPLIDRCSILFLNEKEAQALAGRDVNRAAEKLHKLGGATVAVTLGEKGAVVCGKEGVQRTPGFKVPVVDTTGAGDAFSAGFLFGVLKGYSSAACAKVGNFVASLCVQRMGARSGIPDAAELAAFEEKDLS
ncbi:ribokinase [archaeon BMS3Abin16]|nr:ribokinase [archaeon BMS3Abin16]